MTPRLAQPFAPDLGAEPPAWTLSAVCQSVDPEVFFPEKGEGVREAKRVCGGCAVRVECLTWTLATEATIGKRDGFVGHIHGIYGGLTAQERTRLLKQRQGERPPRPIAHGTEAGYKAHQRRGEPPCRACTDGSARAVSARRHANRKAPAA